MNPRAGSGSQDEDSSRRGRSARDAREDRGKSRNGSYATPSRIEVARPARPARRPAPPRALHSGRSSRRQRRRTARLARLPRLHGSPQIAQAASSRKRTRQPPGSASTRFARTSSGYPLPLEDRLDQLVESGRDYKRLRAAATSRRPARTCTCSTTQSTTSGSDAVIAANSLGDLLVQGQVDADPRLELGEDRWVAELMDDLDERVPDGDRPVPVEYEPHPLEMGGEAGVGRSLVARLVPRERVLAVVQVARERRQP